jgi:nicotinate-nucleotide pyrophosphorylase (carboxylating)
MKSGASDPCGDTPQARPEKSRASALAAHGFDGPVPLAFPLSPEETTARVKAALEEDHADNDLTSIATIVSDRHARCAMVSRKAGVVCGAALAIEAFRQRDPHIAIREDVADGGVVERGSIVLFLNGNARGLLGAERVALNFMQRLSGIASLTAQYVAAVAGTKARILDTRKTTPGWRSLEKYAVRCGGGMNHRNDLSQAILIKDNHLAAVDGDVKLAVARAKEVASPDVRIEVECDRLDQVSAALKAGADVIMVDNMSLRDMREAVQMVCGRAVIEASGGVNLQTVTAIAETGVHWISVGSLTHSPPALDLGIDFE